MKEKLLENLKKWGAASLLVVWASVWLVQNMRDLGNHIVESFVDPASHPLTLDYTMGVLWWGAFALGIFVFARESRRMLLLAWTAKFFVVLVFMLFYEQKYGLDAFNYFFHAYDSTLTEEDWDSLHNGFLPALVPGLTSEGTISRGEVVNVNFKVITILLALMTGSFYHAMKVICAFVGLMGVFLFYRAAVIALARPCPQVFYLLAFFPSILFWSSILGKDPLQFFFLGLYAYGGVLWFEKGGAMAFSVCALGLAGNYVLRPWSSLMAFAALGLAMLLGKRRGGVQAIVMLVVVGLVFFAGRNRLDDLRSAIVVEWLLASSTGFIDDTVRTGGTGTDISELSSLGGAGLPIIVFSGLFRPLPFDARNAFLAMAAIENTIVLILTITAIRRFRFAYFGEPLVTWTILYVLAWALLYGLIVLGNFGAGSRFKIQMWPFFLMFLGMLASREGRAWLDLRVGRNGKRARQSAMGTC